VGARSRETVFVNEAVGPDKEVSLVVESQLPIVAERPMYFNYKGSWTGGHDVVGIGSPLDTFFFAEGYTGEGFEEYLCLMNPGEADTVAHITYMFPDGTTQEQEVPVGARSRETVFVNEAVGPDKEVSINLKADSPIVAERPMYFNYKGSWTGGHDVIGDTGPRDVFYFAEGYTGEGFDEFLCFMNVGFEAGTVHITYMFADGTTQEQELPIGARSRATVNVKEVVGPGRSVSVKVQSNLPIVAERPMYFNYKGSWTGGHDVVGYTP
jgi:hypothetical protein